MSIELRGPLFVLRSEPLISNPDPPMRRTRSLSSQKEKLKKKKKEKKRRGGQREEKIKEKNSTKIKKIKKSIICINEGLYRQLTTEPLKKKKQSYEKSQKGKKKGEKLGGKKKETP